MRLFVALEIPEAVRENLTALQIEIQKTLQDRKAELRWVRSENFHVTLKFIGEASTEELPAIMEELRGVRPDGAVKANFRGLGYSWNARRGGVFWATMQSSDFLKMLTAQINRRLERLGISADERDFLPHLTLARFKHHNALLVVRSAVAENTDRDIGSLQAEEFHLMKSILGPGGSKYSAMASFRFAMAANA
jgi:2'-5' RNA ligase